MSVPPRYGFQPEEYRQRPRDFDPSIAHDMIERIANGENLADMCKDLSLPLPATFLRWVSGDNDLNQAYEEALELRARYYVEQMIPITSGMDDRRARLEFESRKFVAERQLPHVFGNKPERTKGDKIVKPDGRDELRRRIDAIVARSESKQKSSQRQDSNA